MIIRSLVFLLLAVIAVGCEQVRSGEIQETLQVGEVVQHIEPNITESEKELLETRIPQILGWLNKWDRQLACPGPIQNDGRAWQAKYRQVLNSEVEVVALPQAGNFQLKVYIPQVGVALSFNRKPPGELEVFDWAPICGEVGNSEADVRFTIELKREPNSDAVPSRTKLLDAIRSHINDEVCADFNGANVNIPDFQVGDPAIYLLIESKTEVWIEWDSFIFDTDKREYLPRMVKRFGRPDEIAHIKKVIKETKLETIRCPKTP